MRVLSVDALPELLRDIRQTTTVVFSGWHGRITANLLVRCLTPSWASASALQLDHDRKSNVSRWMKLSYATFRPKGQGVGELIPRGHPLEIEFLVKLPNSMIRGARQTALMVLISATLRPTAPFHVFIPPALPFLEISSVLSPAHPHTNTPTFTFGSLTNSSMDVRPGVKDTSPHSPPS